MVHLANSTKYESTLTLTMDKSIETELIQVL